MADVIARANTGEPLDAVIWRVAGLGASALNTVLAANPALAGAPVALAQGTSVTIPATAAQPAAKPLVQLWD